MKKIILILFSVLSINSFSQDSIPNSGFENWLGSFYLQAWQTTNLLLPVGVKNVSQTTNSYEGESAIHLKTIDLDGMIVPGVATLGTLDFGATYGGIPFSSRPESLTGFVIHPSTGDEVWIFIEFFKNGLTIGSGSWSSTDSIGEFTQFTTPIEFFSSEDPDTMNITILTDWFYEGSSMILDDLSFNYPLTQINLMDIPNSLLVYPNPFTNHITIETSNEVIHSVIITDLNGTIVYKENFEGKSLLKHLPIKELIAGIYFMVIQTDQQVISQMIIKR